MSDDVRMGSAPNFCPPVEEGITFTMEDERGDETVMEFLGLILHNGRRYGFFFPVTDETPAKSSGEVVLLEVTELDDEDQPAAFELVDIPNGFDVARLGLSALAVVLTVRQVDSAARAPCLLEIQNQLLTCGYIPLIISQYATMRHI